VDPHAFAAFLPGPRQCIGQVFAMLEFKAISSSGSLASFRLDATPEMEGDVALVNPSPLLRPKGVSQCEDQQAERDRCSSCGSPDSRSCCRWLS
jgi:hypothetical protein